MHSSATRESYESSTNSSRGRVSRCRRCLYAKSQQHRLTSLLRQTALNNNAPSVPRTGTPPSIGNDSSAGRMKRDDACAVALARCNASLRALLGYASSWSFLLSPFVLFHGEMLKYERTACCLLSTFRDHFSFISTQHNQHQQNTS